MSTKRKDDSAPVTKADLLDVRSGLLGEIRAEAKETRRHFDVVAEQMFHEFRGAFGDRTSQHNDTLQNHEHRLQTVERRLGLVA